MAKLPTITTITSANNNISVLNSNFSALRSAFTNFLSRDGETPNTMTADLDLNSNDILNVSTLNAAEFYLAGVLVANLAAFPTWSGVWTTTTAYTAYDLVYHDDGTTQSLYRAKADHTAGTFATDLAADLWEIYNPYVIDQAGVRITGGAIDGTTVGATTASTGDFTDLTVTADLDVSGVTNLSTVRTDLGLAIGTDVQAQDAELQDISDITFVQGDILYHDGTNIVDLPIGTAGQVLKTNSGATAPEWATNDAATQSFVIACSDETTDLATGTAAVTFRMPYAFTVSEVRASVTTAPTGAAIQVDINEGGVSILSTKLTIDATEKTSESAATPPVISDSSLADDAEMTIDIDAVGSTVAGTGLKVMIIGTKT